MELSDNIIKVLEYISKKFGVAIDFTNKNVAPYLQKLATKYINYKVNTDIFWIVVFLFLSILGILGIIYQCKSEDKWYTDWDDIFPFIGVLGIIDIIVCFIFICVNIYNIVICKTFPEKVLFDYIISLKNSL